MPYSGSLEVFGAIGKAEAAYFELINERGGINGRKVRFISYDDKSDPSTALDLTRGLIEKDDVLLMFGSFGTPGNFAVRAYLNEKQIPQLLLPPRRSSERVDVPVDNGLAALHSGRGAHLRQLHTGALPRKEDVALWRTIISVENCSRDWKTGSVTSPG